MQLSKISNRLTIRYEYMLLSVFTDLDIFSGLPSIKYCHGACQLTIMINKTAITNDIFFNEFLLLDTIYPF